MTGVMTPGRPSPPLGDWHELPNVEEGITTVDIDACVLLPASVDVVGGRVGDRDDRWAAVFAALGIDCRNAAGT